MQVRLLPRLPHYHAPDRTASVAASKTAIRGSIPRGCAMWEMPKGSRRRSAKPLLSGSSPGSHSIGGREATATLSGSENQLSEKDPDGGSTPPLSATTLKFLLILFRELHAKTRQDFSVQSGWPGCRICPLIPGFGGRFQISGLPWDSARLSARTPKLAPLPTGSSAVLSAKTPSGTAMGMRVVRTPVRAPQANSICDRFGGTLRRECLDFLIPLNERHMKLTLEIMGHAFQPRQTAHEFGPGDTGAIPASPAGK
jgi:hypothetical protein